MAVSKQDCSAQTEPPLVNFNHSSAPKNQSRYAFARRNKPSTSMSQPKVSTSDELVHGILSSVGESWFDGACSSSSSLEAGDATTAQVLSLSSSREGLMNYAGESCCRGVIQPAPSMLWLTQIGKREIGHCVEEIGKGILDGMSMHEVLIQKEMGVKSHCCLCQKGDLLQQAREAIQILHGMGNSFIQWPMHVESSCYCLRMLTPLTATTVAAVIASRQNLREGLEEHGRFLAACLVEGASYLHDHNVLHRDVTPDNVFLDYRGYAKIANFHHAIRAFPGQYVQGECGSVGYQAPEVIASLGHMHTVDYWGIGCVIYQFLFGFTPYADEDENRLRSKTVLNPEFAITRLGNRFRHLSYNGQEAIKLFMCKYPHKRMGYKPQEVTKIKWFQPYKWCTIANQTVNSPLQMFLHNVQLENSRSTRQEERDHQRQMFFDGEHRSGEYGAIGQRHVNARGSSSCSWSPKTSNILRKVPSSPTVMQNRSQSRFSWAQGNATTNVPIEQFQYQSGDASSPQDIPATRTSSAEKVDDYSYFENGVYHECYIPRSGTPNDTSNGKNGYTSAPVTSPILPAPGCDIWRHVNGENETRARVSLMQKANMNTYPGSTDILTKQYLKPVSQSRHNTIFSANGKQVQIARRLAGVTSSEDILSEFNKLQMNDLKLVPKPIKFEEQIIDAIDLMPGETLDIMPFHDYVQGATVPQANTSQEIHPAPMMRVSIHGVEASEEIRNAPTMLSCQDFDIGMGEGSEIDRTNYM